MRHINNSKISTSFMKLVDIMEKLRSPSGCSWDRKQNHNTLKKYVIEEAEEVVEAIESGDILNIREELGDLMMLIVFHSQIAKENGTFTIAEVCDGICEKLIHRHPHVFGDNSAKIDSEAVIKQWDEIKVTEKAEKLKISSRMEEMLNLPSQLQATEYIQKEAAKVGFDFQSTADALNKIFEEATEVKAELKKDDSANAEHLAEEIGDLLFATINVARLSGFDTSSLLYKATNKFVSRFSQVEKMASENGGFNNKSLEELDKYWDSIKLTE